MSKRPLSLLVLSLLIAVGSLRAQPTPRVEVFCGAELSYADVNFTRLYDVLINATPGVKWHLGHDWMVSAQGWLPMVNDGYDQRYNMIRLSMANLSKEVHFSQARQYLKFTAGLFNRDRYGVDARWFFPITDWLLLHARCGVTSPWVLGFNFHGLHESRFESDWSTMAIGGASIWLRPWQTELRASGGRYLEEDYGAEAEAIRHFRHCSVSLFAQYHERAKSDWIRGTHRYGGGFRVVMMLPPYKKPQRTVVVRPASNFRLTYNAQSDGHSMKRYSTDPEENERTLPVDMPWGTGTIGD